MSSSKYHLGAKLAVAFRKGKKSVTVKGEKYTLPEWQTTGTYTQCQTYVQDIERKLYAGEFKTSKGFVHVQ